MKLLSSRTKTNLKQNKMIHNEIVEPFFFPCDLEDRDTHEEVR